MTEQEILEKAMREQEQKVAGYGERKVVDETEVYKQLTREFEAEALSTDSSRGFDLTSVKAQYVIERLNETFGIMNWTFGGDYKEVEGGVLFMGALVVTVNGKQNRHFAPGFAANKKNLGDTYKGAHTDSLSKCASKFGVANSVFKGLIAAPSKTGGSSRPTKKALASTIVPPENSTVELEKPVQRKPRGFNTRRTTPSLKG